MEDDAHFENWFDQEYRRVLSAVLVVCAGDVVRAEDATNDAFLTAYEKWHRVRSMQSPRAWVTKVAINRAKKSWRRGQRYVPLANQPEVAATVREVDPDLWAAVGKLTFKQRTALAMRYVEDLTQAQIADALDVAPGTVSATLTQARQRVRTELNGEAQ